MSKNIDLVTMPDGVRPRAVVGFFHGGAFVNGEPKQFKKAANRLAEREIGSVSFAYRTHSQDGAMVRDVIEDAKNCSARLEAAHASIPLFFSGASSGGILAVHAALRVPTAGAILFNPVLDLSPDGFYNRKVMAGDEVDVSALHMPLDGFPPTLIFHGSADNAVPIETSARFAVRLTDLGIRCELVRYEGLAHRMLKLVPMDELMSRMTGFIDGLV